MKVYERFLKACLGRKIVVRYGRCSEGRCEVRGELLAFDNFCLLLLVREGIGSRSSEKLVLINKKEVESMEIVGRENVQEFWWAYEKLKGN
jgi:small nuclear ribonucleoprotein (snRNP)-like protein